MTIESTTDEHELLSEISNAERKVAEKESVVNDLKEQMKIAKEDYEIAVSKLRVLCRQQSNDADRPLFKDDAVAELGKVVASNGSGIDSVTLSVPGKKSVTITKQMAKNAASAAKKLRKAK